jgi:hypothetical protein
MRRGACQEGECTQTECWGERNAPMSPQKRLNVRGSRVAGETRNSTFF